MQDQTKPSAPPAAPTAEDLYKILQTRNYPSQTFASLSGDGVVKLRLNHDALGPVQVDFANGCWEVWIVGRAVTGAIRHTLPSGPTLTWQLVHAEIERGLVTTAKLLGPHDLEAARFVAEVEKRKAEKIKAAVPQAPTTEYRWDSAPDSEPRHVGAPTILPVPQAILPALHVLGLRDVALGLPPVVYSEADHLAAARMADRAELAAVLRNRHGGAFVLALAATIDTLLLADVRNGPTALEAAQQAIKAQHAAGDLSVHVNAASAIATFASKALGAVSLQLLGDIGECGEGARRTGDDL